MTFSFIFQCKGLAEQKKNHPPVGAISENKLCQELCGQDVSSQLACHTFHLNKPTVFTLNNGHKKVIKSVISTEDREEAVDEPDEASEVRARILEQFISTVCKYLCYFANHCYIKITV